MQQLSLRDVHDEYNTDAQWRLAHSIYHIFARTMNLQFIGSQ
jgi:hypothetical protein